MAHGEGIEAPDENSTSVEEWKAYAEQLQEAYFAEKSDRKSWANIAENYADELKDLKEFYKFVRQSAHWEIERKLITDVISVIVEVIRSTEKYREEIWSDDE